MYSCVYANRSSSTGVVVYDITDDVSFKHIDSWITEFKEQCPDAHIVIAGNKCDLNTMRVVTKSQAQSKAKEFGCFHVEVSAKTEENILELFKHIAIMIYKQGRPDASDTCLTLR